MASQKQLSAKSKKASQLYQAIIILLLLSGVACTQTESLADSSPVRQTVAATKTAVPTPPLVPTTTLALTTSPAPELPTITQPLRTDQIIWFMQDGKLWRSDVQGARLDQLADDKFLGFGEIEGLGLYSLRLSPDGRWLANPTHQDNKLHILDVGTRQERILPVSVTALAWAPDSLTLAYAPARTFPASAKPDCALCLYDLVTDTHTSLIPNSDPAFETISTLVWSADGANLAYTCCFIPREPYEGINDGRLEIIHIATGQRRDEGRLVSSVGGGVERFCWHGETIVTTDLSQADQCATTPLDWFTQSSRNDLLAAWEAVRDSSGEWTAIRLYVTIQTTGELIWERTLETTKALRLGWSPDGRYLFFDDGSSDSPIWRLTADNSDLRQISPDGILLGIVNRWAATQ